MLDRHGLARAPQRRGQQPALGQRPHHAGNVVDAGRRIGEAIRRGCEVGRVAHRAGFDGRLGAVKKGIEHLGVETALARLLVVVENYPTLRSNETFNRLMDELSGTENRLAVERMRYNERVQEYNTSRRQFPSNITARLFGFKEYQLFNAPPEAERVPRVNFGTSGR